MSQSSHLSISPQDTVANELEKMKSTVPLKVKKKTKKQRKADRNNFAGATEKMESKIPLKMKKKTKKQRIADRNNVVGATNDEHPRKLLIFDLNKVLISRFPRTSNYEIRPYAREFLIGMSEKYQLAIWTSMKNKNGKKIIADLFNNIPVSVQLTSANGNPTIDSSIVSGDYTLVCQSRTHSIETIFTWYQDKCTPVPIIESSHGSKNSYTSSHIIAENYDQHDIPNGVSSISQDSTSIEAESTPKQHTSSKKSDINNINNNNNNNDNPRTVILSKDLLKVWHTFNQFNEFNTILLDDSPEKCGHNPSHSIIHPFPYDLSHKDIDVELKPHGPLWTYLYSLADHDSQNYSSSSNNDKKNEMKSSYVDRLPYVSPMHDIIASSTQQQNHQQQQK